MASATDLERATLVALLRIRPRGLTWPQLVAEILEHGGAGPAWDALSELSLFDTDADLQAAIDRAAEDIASWTASEVGFHTFLDRAYPSQLSEIHQMPPVLFSRGTLAADDHVVSVVGSRRASERGRRWASTLAEALVDAGVTVVSGLAEGIDTAAHTAALDAGGRTVAIIGTGINRVYPSANKDLQERIVHKGLVLSQFWPDALPTRNSFPMRNATMSGYGRATVVVEAGEKVAPGSRRGSRSNMAAQYETRGARLDQCGGRTRRRRGGHPRSRGRTGRPAHRLADVTSSSRRLTEEGIRRICECYRCHLDRQRFGKGLADLVVPISYGVKDAQSGHLMWTSTQIQPIRCGGTGR